MTVKHFTKLALGRTLSITCILAFAPLFLAFFGFAFALDALIRFGDWIEEQ